MNWQDFLNQTVGSIGQNLENNANQGAANIAVQMTETELAKSQLDHQNQMQLQAAKTRERVLLGLAVLFTVAIGGVIFIFAKKQ